MGANWECQNYQRFSQTKSLLVGGKRAEHIGGIKFQKFKKKKKKKGELVMSYSINDRVKMMCDDLMEMTKKITLYADAAFQYEDSDDMSDDLYDIAETIYHTIEKYYPDTDRKI